MGSYLDRIVTVMTKVGKTKVFIDAFPLSTTKLSGIGHLLLSFVYEFDKCAEKESIEFILVASPKVIEAIKKNYKFKNIKYKKIPLKGKIFNALVLWRLMLPVDLLFGKGVYVFFNYTKWPLSFSRSITFIHDLSFIRYPETLRPNVLRVLSKNVQRWAKNSTVVGTISQNTKNEIVKYLDVDKEKIKVVYAGVDTSKFYKREKPEVEKVLKKYKLPANYILYVSNIEPRKNIEVLLDGYLKLPVNIHKKYSLVLIGADGWNNKTILDKINNLQAKGHKIIRPDQYVKEEDLPSIYSGASLLAHPAIYEGFGLSPLQAIAVGTKIVIADNSSLKEIYSKVGILFKTGDSKDLSDKIVLALEGKINERERSELLKKYTITDCCQRLTQVIKEIKPVS